QFGLSNKTGLLRFARNDERLLLPIQMFKQPSPLLSSPGLTGRSSIPETAVLDRDVSGILDARFRGHDSEGCAPHSRGAIAPEFGFGIRGRHRRCQMAVLPTPAGHHVQVPAWRARDVGR